MASTNRSGVISTGAARRRRRPGGRGSGAGFPCPGATRPASLSPATRPGPTAVLGPGSPDLAGDTSATSTRPSCAASRTAAVQTRPAPAPGRAGHRRTGAAARRRPGRDSIASSPSAFVIQAAVCGRVLRGGGARAPGSWAHAWGSASAGRVRPRWCHGAEHLDRAARPARSTTSPTLSPEPSGGPAGGARAGQVDLEHPRLRQPVEQPESPHCKRSRVLPVRSARAITSPWSLCRRRSKRRPRPSNVAPPLVVGDEHDPVDPVGSSVGPGCRRAAARTCRPPSRSIHSLPAVPPR